MIVEPFRGLAVKVEQKNIWLRLAGNLPGGLSSMYMMIMEYNQLRPMKMKMKDTIHMKLNQSILPLTSNCF